MPRDTSFYTSLIKFMEIAFIDNNFEFIGISELFNEKELIKFCYKWKPDVIMEMNRSRKQVPYLPKDIIHIAWVVDPAEGRYDIYQDSEIIYFFGAHWINHHQNEGESFVDWLAPGACVKHYSYDERPIESDFFFAGHIPEAWSEESRDRIVVSSEKCVITFGEIYDLCTERWNQVDEIRAVNKRLSIAHDIIEEKTGERIKLVDKDICYDLSSRSGRLAGRKELMDLALSVSGSVRIFGSPSWLTHESYKKYYHGFVSDPNELRTLYQSSLLTLHEGIGGHFRTYDSLLSGGCLFYREAPHDYEYGGINTFLEPGVDFVLFDQDNFREQANCYLSDTEKRKKMCRNGSEKILNGHTWDHRIKKISYDLSNI